MSAKRQGTILIVDDEEYVRDSLAIVLHRRGYTVRSTGNPGELMQDDSLEGLDAVITDLRMPGTDGLTLIKSVHRREPGLPVLVLTGHGSVPSAVECMKAGAADYLQKPVEPEELVLVLEKLLKQAGMERELAYLRSAQQPAQTGPGRLIGKSPLWREVIDLVEAAAPTDSSILLLGESGVGKDEIAKLIHQRSRRSSKPFVRVNCAAIPLDLFESEFFGHRKGAFTGALEEREGRFRVAHEGTLFMDEIACLPEAAQAKVLRVLQDGLFERVGDSRHTSVDVRLVSATNSDLEAEIEAGRFRRDLFYRINVLTVEIPPLRKRRDDIPELAEAFLSELSRRMGKNLSALEPAALKALCGYEWPGNVRELRNVIERAVLLEKTDALTLSSLPLNVRQEDSEPGSSSFNLRERLAEEEERLLIEALKASGGVRREAAHLLGIDERNLSYFLKKHGLSDLKIKP